MPKKIVSRATRVKIRLGQIAAQEKKATEAFNKVMHEPVTLPELDIKKFLAEFEAEPDNAWMMGSGQPFSDWVENVIEDISLMAGLRTRLTTAIRGGVVVRSTSTLRRRRSG